MAPQTHDPRFLAGLRLFYQGHYFESHEEWEAIWRESSGAIRSFYQGLILIDAAILHTQRGHWRGVTSLLKKSLAYLDDCADTTEGMDIRRLRTLLRNYRREAVMLRDGHKQTFDPSRIPELIVDGIDRDTFIESSDDARDPGGM